MDRSLDPQTIAAMRALCEKISVSRQLDEEIQKELYTHVEDKLLGYLTGAEKVSEADALLLVEKHFGEPAVVAELMRDAHPVAATLGLLERLGWALIFLFGLSIATGICARIVELMYFPLLRALPYPMWFFGRCIWGMGLSIGLLWLLWRRLARDQSAPGAPMRPLGFASSVRQLSAVVAIVVMVSMALEYVPTRYYGVTDYAGHTYAELADYEELINATNLVNTILQQSLLATFLWWWWARPGWTWRWTPAVIACSVLYSLLQVMPGIAMLYERMTMALGAAPDFHWWLKQMPVIGGFGVSTLPFLAVGAALYWLVLHPREKTVRRPGVS